MNRIEELKTIKKELDLVFAKLFEFGMKINPEDLSDISKEQFIIQLHREIGTEELEESLIELDKGE